MGFEGYRHHHHQLFQQRDPSGPSRDLSHLAARVRSGEFYNSFAYVRPNPRISRVPVVETTKRGWLTRRQTTRSQTKCVHGSHTPCVTRGRWVGRLAQVVLHFFYLLVPWVALKSARCCCCCCCFCLLLRLLLVVLNT